MIYFEDAGYYTTLQDEGRMGYRHLGVPVSGAVDQNAFRLANELLPVENDLSVLECHFQGPVIRFEQTLSFVITGALVEAWLNDLPLQRQKIYRAQAGDCLQIGKVQKGVRSYLKFSAVWDVPSPMGSSAQFYPLTAKAFFEKGDRLVGRPVNTFDGKSHARLKILDNYLDSAYLDVYAAPDFSQLTISEVNKIFETPLRVLSQNRMGYRIQGLTGLKASASLSSQIVLPGMVQLTPSGQLLIAMADAQVTGGYAQILQLTPHAQCILSQKREGDTFKFCNVPQTEEF